MFNLSIQKIIFIIILSFGFVSWQFNTKAFIWDDAYFYLVIARNIVLSGQQSFSNIFPTNGFHPLWLYLLTAYSYIISFFKPEILFNVSYAVPLSVILTGWGAFNFLKAAELLKLPKILFVGLPLGYIFFFPILYSEAIVYYVSLSLLTLLSVNGTIKKSRGAYSIGFVCAFVFFSRLDSVFIIFCYLIFYWQTTRRSVTCLARLLATFILIVCPYLLSNVYFFGGLMPVSGWMKSSFPIVFLNKPLSWNSLFGYNIFAGILPIVLSAFILVAERNSEKRIRNITHVYFFGSLLHCGYTVCFTRFHTMYWWYYISHAILASFAISIIQKKYLSPKIYYCLVYSAIALFFCATIFYRWGNTFSDKQFENSITKTIDSLNQNNIRGKSILVSDLPGVLAFFTNNNIIAADMLTANIKFYKEMREYPNALDFIMGYCRKMNKPLEYYMDMCKWMHFIDAEKKGESLMLIYNNPKSYPLLEPIGNFEVHLLSTLDGVLAECSIFKLNELQ